MILLLVAATSRIRARLRPLFSEEYANPVVKTLSRVLPAQRPLDVDWNKPKSSGTPAEMAQRLEAGLRANEWFVTGNVMPEYFADDFEFVDPDVSVSGIRDYAEGVRRLFAEDARAEVVACDLVDNVVNVTWRLSGGVNIGVFGLKLKPYIVYTELHLRDGLVVFQRDRFDLPGWDILLSAIAPWLPFLAPPAPPVDDLRQQLKS